ncbi:MAG: hypothetical protein SFH39_00335 [Candidatus Magnetobacterium sp. LHC-1]
MTVQEIINQAIVHIRMSIDSVYGRTHINEAMHELAMKYDTACVKTTTTISCTDSDAYYSMPSDCLKVIRVYDSDGDEYDKTLYRFEQFQIKLDDEDTYTVHYLTTPDSVADNTETPDVNSAYHRPIALFVASKELEDIKPDKSSILLSKFYAQVDDVNSKLMNPKKRLAKTPIPGFR